MMIEPESASWPAVLQTPDLRAKVCGGGSEGIAVVVGRYLLLHESCLVKNLTRIKAIHS